MMIFVQEFHLFIIVKATGNNCKEILIEVPIILSFNLKSRAFERKMQKFFSHVEGLLHRMKQEFPLFEK
jgi:hypothetical protein